MSHEVGITLALFAVALTAVMVLICLDMRRRRR